MISNQLGQTGLQVSVIGIGTGGPSRLGLTSGSSRDTAIKLVLAGLDRGINIVDSAPTYGTEEPVGDAIRSNRERVIVSTKAALGPYFGPVDGSRVASRLSARIGEDMSFVLSATALEKRVNASLRRLKTDYIDVFYLHAVTPAQYDQAIVRLVPTLSRMKDSGKIRFFGITEAFGLDRTHRMLTRAITESAFDCIMIGFNCLNQSGASIAAEAKRRGVGTVGMHAVRDLQRKESLQPLMNKLVSMGILNDVDGDAERLIRILNDHGVASLAEAAMRFCRHELQADVVLTGTGDLSHLDANIAACQAGPLPDVISREFRRLVPQSSSRRDEERDPVRHTV